MATAVGVLCARVRVEEKQLITAFGEAGAVAMPVSPMSLPLPPCPAPQDIAALGDSSDAGILGADGVIIDRSTNRQVARPFARLLRQSGVRVIDAGLASTRNRQEVATALTRAGLPRPKTMIAFSEATGVQAAGMVGYPATLLPMIPGTASTTLHDADTADAVIEHRIVLGSADEAVILVQAGALSDDHLHRIHVVGGEAVAYDGPIPSAAMTDLACKAANVIGAAVVAIEIATIEGELVVWDAIPVAEFRKSTLLGTKTVAEAIAALISPSGAVEEARDVLALTA
jgi:[lysine-biosynthesis-protein LysW]---L-2-aminoadipate ligase